MMHMTVRSPGRALARAAVLLLAGALPALAQSVALTPTQTSVLQGQLTTAVQGAAGNAVQMASAISLVVQRAVAADGEASAGSITSVVLTYGEGLGASGDALGTGLGQAAATLAPADCSATACGAALAMAQDIANEGNAAEIAAFQAAVIAAGFPALAVVAGSAATPTAEINANTNTADNSVFTPAPTGNTTVNCLNPSCTRAF